MSKAIDLLIGFVTEKCSQLLTAQSDMDKNTF